MKRPVSAALTVSENWGSVENNCPVARSVVLELERPGFKSWFILLSCCMTLDKLLNFSEPQFSGV